MQRNSIYIYTNELYMALHVIACNVIAFKYAQMSLMALYVIASNVIAFKYSQIS